MTLQIVKDGAIYKYTCDVCKKERESTQGYADLSRHPDQYITIEEGSGRTINGVRVHTLRNNCRYCGYLSSGTAVCVDNNCVCIN